MAAKDYHAGRLDHRVRILRPTRTASAYNEKIATYSLYREVWASRVDASAAESYRADAVEARVSARFAVRYSPEMATVTASDRLQVEGGLTYDVTKVREVSRNQWIEIDAVARAD